MNDMVDKLRQVEDKLLLKLLEKPDKWNYSTSSTYPMVEKCQILEGNYIISLVFNHTNLNFDFHKPEILHKDTGFDFLSGKYNINVNQNITQADKCNIYMSICSGNSFSIDPLEGVCAEIRLFEGKMNDIVKSEGNNRVRIQEMLDWFKTIGIEKARNIRTIDNRVIKRGDWVALDLNLLDYGAKIYFDRFIGKKGFVINREKDVIDVRFGTERKEVTSMFLKKTEKEDSVEEDLKQKLPNPDEPMIWFG